MPRHERVRHDQGMVHALAPRGGAGYARTTVGTCRGSGTVGGADRQRAGAGARGSAAGRAAAPGAPPPSPIGTSSSGAATASFARDARAGASGSVPSAERGG